jgi:hypothetical protein
MAAAAGMNAEVEAGLARLREATAPFRDLAVAVAAGYAGESQTCLAHPPDGAMGYHHVNRAHVDARIELEQPEILTYERQADGRYVLTGVEYLIPFQLWPADSTPPTVLGQPLRPGPNVGAWYLHVWAWKANPSGLFANWNPAVHCPAR